MLHINPDKRISAKEAYSDSWVARNANSNPLNTKCLENIRNFDAKNKLKTSIMAFIATQIMNSQEQSELRKAFSAMDKDGDGVLDKQEIIDGYFQFYGDKEIAEQIANQLLENVDYNQSGKIDYSEFLVSAMAKEKLLSTQKIEQAFQLFDKDGDGFLDQSELNEIMGEIDEEKWQMILDEYDANQDGKISKDEFIELLQKNVEEEKKK
eukprot:TRINITY_DN13920_c0_g2_i1.p3 TRINITY_DN13920_c0_g2~~TRINITY_DN13920_c0_g2_i1.p3  ORF type:complete len:209 (-),score=61.01 TRINITY_DN13920_c0_g2_i1:43-669(-)